MPGDPFHIETLPNAPLRRAALVAARPLLSWLLRLPTYRALYAHAQMAGGASFEARALAALDIQPVCSSAEIESIPARGPVVIASNHPHGALDGLLLASTARHVRSDIRILTNHLLARIPELTDLCFFVDPFGGPVAAARSRAGLRAAHLWLRNGGALIVFPAGEVAHHRRGDGSHADSPWFPTLGRLVASSGATVVPSFIDGNNSRLFYTAGRVHPSLRTALLARELLNKRGDRVRVRIGRPLARNGDEPANLTTRIRAAVEELRGTTQSVRRSIDRTDAIAWDIARLPTDALLVESGAFQVFCADARHIPSALREIGRLREIAYRAVGEGTGRALDLDTFDEHYLHLFSWDREQHRIVGAYRIGQTDRIVAASGVSGLYTRTLFRYDERLIARLSPALELGRSFIRPEYQKNYNALLLLWKGIGRFIVRHPRYRVLFGPVSISARYSDRSHQLLMAFLQQNHFAGELAELVDAINPQTRQHAPVPGIPQSMDEANRRVMQAEADGKGVPVLLRQYLKLDARLLGFNVDPAFGEALDALMMVDLTAVDPAILVRYFGKREAVEFLARHDKSARPRFAA